MNSDRFRRQQDIIPSEKLESLAVTIIGCGAVGSFTCLTLAKMGVSNICVYDADTVEEHNLSNQWFRPADVGRNKAEALAEIIHEFAEVSLTVHPEHYVRQPLRGIVIGAVDSMDTRLLIWREVKKMVPDLYLDARMGAEVGKIHVVQPGDPSSRRHYEADLYPSSEALHARCTAKATMFCAAGLGALVGALVAGHVMGRQVSSVVVDWRNLVLMGWRRWGEGRVGRGELDGCLASLFMGVGWMDVVSAEKSQMGFPHRGGSLTFDSPVLT